MIKMKNLLAIALILVLITAVVGGCTQTSDNTETAAPTAKATQAAAATAETTEEPSEDGPLTPFEETVTIHVGKVDTFQFYGEDDDYTSAEDNVWIDSMKEVLNVEFVFDWIASDGDANNVKWNTAIASGDLPDMGIVGGNIYESLLEAGMIADMTDMFGTYASPNYQMLCESCPEIPYMTREGILYGLPHLKSSPQYFHVLVVRQDWLDRVDMEVPTTIDELVEVATAFKEAQLGGENTYGLAVGNTPEYYWGSLKGFFQGYGIPYSVWAEDENGNVYYGNTDERMKDALLKLQEMYANGLLRQDYTVANVTESVTAGEAGMMYCICYGPVAAVDLYQLDDEVDMIAAEIPTLDGSLPTYYDSAVPDTFVFVNAEFEYLDAAIKVVNLTVENLYDMSYDWGYLRGVCPIGSVWFEKPFSFCEYYREIEYAYETGDTTKFSTANAKIYYQRLIDFEAGDRSLGKYHPIYRTEVGTYAILNDALQSNRIINTIYVAPNTETMVEKKSLLNELLNTAINKVIMGDDISVWEEAVAEWYATGGQTMTDEVNAWYQAQ